MALPTWKGFVVFLGLISMACLVQAQDNKKPNVTCPGDMDKNVEPSQPDAAVEWTVSATDDVDELGPANVTCRNDSDVEVSSGDRFRAGLHTITCSATDTAGNEGNCTFDITVQDSEPPILTCSNDIIQKPDPGSSTAMVTWDPQPTANDVVDGAIDPSSISCEDGNGTIVTSGGNYTVGVTTITCKASDTSSNEGNCSFSITIDDESPMVTCPDNSTQNVDPSRPDAVVNWSSAPTATDNVDELGPANVTCRNDSDVEVSSGDRFPAGVNTITCSATDTAGNEGNCAFNITVEDNEPPILTCSNDTIENTDPGLPTAVVDWDPQPTANDVVDGGILTVICEDGSGNTVTSGDPYKVGVTTITCKASDKSSNEGNCSFAITVVDNEDPVVTCPGDIDQNVQPSQPDAAVEWTVSATDNVDELGPGNVTCRNDSDVEVSSGDRFPAGLHTITCSASDTAGNEGNCAFNITVTDNEAPIVSCPNDTSQNVDPSQPDAAVYWNPLPSATDVVGPPNPNVTCKDESDAEKVSGDTFPVGVNTITCSATDDAGNEGQCTFTITVIDNEKPNVICPNDATENVEPSLPDAAVIWSPLPSATDNVDPPSPVVTCKDESDTEKVSGDRFVAGLHTIICSATDTAGNEGNCTFIITVRDNEAPNITCPNDRSVNVAEGKSTASVTWVSMANDAVDGKLDTSCEPQSGTEFANTTLVTCTATDEAGNSESCDFAITVTVDGQQCPLTPTNRCICDSMGNCVCKEGKSGPDCEVEDGERCLETDPPDPNCDCPASPDPSPCKCQPGFKGLYCNECKGCMNGGSFQDIENCQCECPSEGFDDPICSGCEECVNGGNQNEVCVCECPGLFEGDLCDVCRARCENGGTLDEATCTCECTSPFTGPTCLGCLPCVNINEGTYQNATTCACDCLEGFLPPLCADCMECQNGGEYQNEATCACECPFLYTGLLCTVCPSGDPCENGGEMDKVACSCKCTDEWTGINCGEPVPTLPDDEYQVPPDADIEKKVSIEIEVTDNKNCEPALNKSSKACEVLQKEFVAGVEIEYKRVAGFKKVEITDLRNGSVIFQHQAIYDYAKMSPSQRGISALDLYRATVAQAVEAGQLGGLPVAPECSTCQAPQDETNMCETEQPTCGTGLVIDKVTEGNSCYFVCRASCKVEADYCNSGTCTQDSDGVKSCSCPQSTEFMYIGANCQLAVNLLWLYIGCGLGGGLLLLLLFTLICCVVQYRKKVKQFESEDEEGTQEDDMRGEVRAVHHNNKGYVGDSSSVADEHPEGETQAPEQVRPYSYIYRNGSGVGVSRSSSGAAAVKNRYEPTVARDREQGTSSDQAEESGGKTRDSYFWGNLNVPVKEEAEMIPMTSEIDPTKMQYKIQRPQVSVNRNDDLPERDYF